MCDISYSYLFVNNKRDRIEVQINIKNNKINIKYVSLFFHIKKDELDIISKIISQNFMESKL